MGVLKNDVGRPSNKTIMIRNILKAILLIVIVLGALGLGYFLRGEENKKSNNKQVTTVKIDEKEEKMDINSKEIMDLYIPFSYFTHEASDEELYFKDKVTKDDLSYEYKNRLAFANYYNLNEGKDLYDKTIKIDDEINADALSSSVLKKYYKKLFGENEKYVAKTFNSYGIDTLDMTYDKENDSYIADLAAGDYTGYRYASELYDAIRKGNKLELFTYVVVLNENFETKKAGVYKNIKDADMYKNAIKEIRTDGSETLIKYKEKEISHNGVYLTDLSDYKKQASTYKLIFEKEKENYVFKSVERVK